MFLQYYGLQEQPFGTTPDPRFYYMSPSHREAFASLVYGIETGRGFSALIAQPGMGKTTLLFQLMERLRNSARTAFLFQNHGNSREFFSDVIADLGLDPAGQDVSALQRQLNEALIRESQQGRHVVLVIDEAQTLGDPVLESVRMLSNFETPKAKLLQIVLAGQPQLADKLTEVGLSQLRQRVSIVSHLSPFDSEETAQYIEHRLKTAGYKGKGLFTREALAIIAEQSEGIPRNINNLCFHALSLGYAKNQKKIDRLTMVEVLNDLDLEPLGTHPPEYHESSQKRFDLDSVTLGSRPGERNRKHAADGDYYLPFMSRRAASRVPGRSQGDVIHWLLWTVALLTVILLGEAFLDSLPAKSQQQVIRQDVSEVIHEAKKVAANHDPFNTQAAVNPQPSTERSTINSGGNNPPVSPNNSTSQPQSQVSLNAAPEQSNLVALDIRTTSPSTANSADVAATLTRAIPPKRDGVRTSNSTSGKDFGSSADAGRLIVESNVSGGKITIDGQSESGWVTPHIFALPPGDYQVSVSKGGYVTWSRNVQINEKHKKWVLASLGLPRGVIVIQTDPPGMQVFIDGKAYGPSEVEASLDIGPHTYKVAPPPGEQPFVGAFNLKAGDILTRKVRWLPGTGSLRIRKGADRSESENRPTPRIGRGTS